MKVCEMKSRVGLLAGSGRPTTLSNSDGLNWNNEGFEDSDQDY